MTEYLQATATIPSLVNPAICAAVFKELEVGRDKRSQYADAARASIAIFIVLSTAALFGTPLLRAFGISLAAFDIPST